LFEGGPYAGTLIVIEDGDVAGIGQCALVELNRCANIQQRCLLVENRTKVIVAKALFL
jgi:hypothetical protein